MAYQWKVLSVNTILHITIHIAAPDTTLHITFILQAGHSPAWAVPALRRVGEEGVGVELAKFTVLPGEGESWGEGDGGVED